MPELIKCPSCGASNADKKSEFDYICNFCESHFTVGQKQKQNSIDDILNQFRQAKHSTNYTSTTPQDGVKAMRMVSIVIFIAFLGVGLGIYFFVRNTVNSAIESIPGQVAEDEYWNVGSSNKFYIFTGEKGPMCWILINQSSKRLDSSKYTIHLVDPIKNRLIKEKHFITMTWKESFNFGNYLSEMIAFNNKVYFLSDAKGINVYDLFTGKMKMSNQQFAQSFSELKSGIVSAKNIGYKNAIELMTNDGYKFYFLPKYEKLVSEVDFNNYQKGQDLIGGFTLVGEPRQKLYYIISKQDTLRNDYSFSEYYLKDYLRKGKSNEKGERGYLVDTSSTFFNVNFLLRNKNQVVFLFTENVAKDSKAYIVSYSNDNFEKHLWKIDLNTIKGFENSIKEGYYLRTSSSNDLLAVWYESASKIAFGLDLKSGKINWSSDYK
jgi:hypothetical protein